MPMSATPSWAMTDPSTYSTIECTMDCGCTTTCTCSGRRSKSQRASMTSRPLFMRVAESTVILAPIRQVGWFSASSTVTRAGSAGGGEQHPAHLRAVVALEALEDRAVLGIHRQQRDAALAGRGGHQAARHHQGFLVGQRDALAAL